jgi:hypothetical protein
VKRRPEARHAETTQGIIAGGGEGLITLTPAGLATSAKLKDARAREGDDYELCKHLERRAHHGLA